ncbi:NADH dehydrogenase [ubiquinone] 1 alpha subcomplex subunit 8 [Fopius arisanus]|uniref:NADH dehydrogenase [ubiquinone] 1 alpha subcomplex subunit 8 n=1 Tax=Fopius arisanus TaxID=64838 RepID=A0A0C9QF32_9HYME|nr:PREDICTED: NADH dehydrogenase [ubiquinone] 1 alpha subcomplex subunit 8 [Fopius arisanus]
MVVTDKTYIPSDEELTVQELNISYPVLQAASFYVGKACEYHNNEFMLCRREEQNPVKCVNEGKAVTACALQFFQKLKKNCRAEFEQYYNCLDKSSGESAFAPCRKTQAVLDKCVLEKLNVERPPYGYFCEVKIHDSKRPKPVDVLPEYEDRIPKLPEDAPKPPARFSGRWMWMS